MPYVDTCSRFERVPARVGPAGYNPAKKGGWARPRDDEVCGRQAVPRIQRGTQQGGRHAGFLHANQGFIHVPTRHHSASLWP